MKIRVRMRCYQIYSVLGILGGCDISTQSVPSSDMEETPQVTLSASLGEPLEFITDEQRALFERGKQLAMHQFSEHEGLGPHFNVTSCGACHEKPVLGGNASRYRQFLLVAKKQDATFSFTGVNGIQDHYNISNPVRNPDDPNTQISALRVPIAFFGAGLIDAIEDRNILKRDDPNDVDGDGISGPVNIDALARIGRFGRKAQNSSIEQFIRGPLFNHMGLTTNPLPLMRLISLKILPPTQPHISLKAVNLLRRRVLEVLEIPHAEAQGAIPTAKPTVDNDGVADPEISEDNLLSLVALATFMAAPRPEPLNDTTTMGKQLFEQTKCTSCHVPSMHSPLGDVFLYSDLLIHDMGESLSDGTQFGRATESEFRTQPLWGIAAAAPYLHDGRAETLDDAIRAHGGEAEASKSLYLQLADSQRDALVAFLESLGGRETRGSGLLVPNSPLPAAGSYGSPQALLNDADTARFTRGREIFDTDFRPSRGLGPLFNGDACRSCHFQPTLGGAGPLDVDVIRYGFLTGPNTFGFPEQGTMAHKHSIFPIRPALDVRGSIFEARQTPHVFGLGAIEHIADSTILFS